MTDVISQLHKSIEYPHLLDVVKAGNFRMSIQASYCHHSSPQEDLPSPMLYNAFEVMIYPSIPRIVKERFNNWNLEERPIPNVPKEILQKLYDMLCEISTKPITIELDVNKLDQMIQEYYGARRAWIMKAKTNPIDGEYIGAGGTCTLTVELTH